MATVIYVVDDELGVDGQTAYPTKRAALGASREEEPRAPVRKVELASEVLSQRELLCALFNREGYAVNQEEV